MSDAQDSREQLRRCLDSREVTADEADRALAGLDREGTWPRPAQATRVDPDRVHLVRAVDYTAAEANPEAEDRGLPRTGTWPAISDGARTGP